MSGLLGVAVGLTILIKKYGVSLGGIDVPMLRELLNYSLPIVLSSVGVALSGSIDRLMVGGYAGLTELGYYGVAARVAAIVGLGFYVISSAITPIVYREHEKPETKILIARVFQVAVYSSVALLFVVAVFSEPIIVLIAGDKFSKASEYVFYLLLSAVIANLYIFFLGMDIAKKTKLLSKINLLSGVSGAIGCIIFVPLIGIWGAIISTLAANTARLGGYVYFSQRIYPVSFVFHWALTSSFALIILNLWLSRI